MSASSARRVPRLFDTAAMIMSHRERVERVADPLRSDPGCEARERSTLALPRVSPADPVGDLVMLALRVAVLRIAGSDADARRGDPGGIHRLRTTTRRLRSELRSLENVVDERWRDQIDGELKWLAGRLGEVRDLDILLARLKKEAGEQDPGAIGRSGPGTAFCGAPEPPRRQPGRSTTPCGAIAIAVSGQSRASGCASRRFRIRRRSRAAWLCPQWPQPRGGGSRKRGGACGRLIPTTAFHELRKRAKRARYTAELIAPIMGRRPARAARRFIRLLTQVQDTLGEHHDAVVAAGEIERVLAEPCP